MCQESSVFGLGKSLGRHAFPFTWFVGISSCVCWGYGDFALAALRAQDVYSFWVILTDVFAIPLAYGSLMYVACLYLGYTLRRRTTMNFLVSIFGGLVMVVCLLVPRILRQIMVAALQNQLLACGLWAFALAVAAVSAHRLWTVT